MLPCLGACALLAGCVRYEPQALTPALTLDALEDRSLTNDVLRDYIAAATRREPPQVTPWPRQDWDFESLTLAAFCYHPSLEVARAEWAVVRAGEVTAGQSPNPALSVSPAYNVTTAAASPWLTVVSLDVPIETAGKRGIRRTHAKQLSESARLKILASAWTVWRDLRAALVDTVAAERRAELSRQLHELHAQIVTAAEAQAKAGLLAPAEVLPWRVAAAKSQLDQLAAARSAIDARARLAEAVGVPAKALDGVRLQFEPAALPEPGTLQQRELRRAALLGRADVLALLAEYQAAESALHLEIAKQYPDVHLSPGYEFDQGDSKWSLSFTVDLPVLNQNQGPIAEAKASRTETGARLLALQAKILAEIDRALTLVETDSQSIGLLAGVAREQAKREDSLAEQFKAGAVDRLELLGAQAETATTRLAELEGQFKLQQSIGALESALQRELPVRAEMVQSPPTSSHAP